MFDKPGPIFIPRREFIEIEKMERKTNVRNGKQLNSVKEKFHMSDLSKIKEESLKPSILIPEKVLDETISKRSKKVNHVVSIQLGSSCMETNTEIVNKHKWY